jgi:hypothetical protein
VWARCPLQAASRRSADNRSVARVEASIAPRPCDALRLAQLSNSANCCCCRHPRLDSRQVKVDGDLNAAIRVHCCASACFRAMAEAALRRRSCCRSDRSACGCRLHFAACKRSSSRIHYEDLLVGLRPCLPKLGREMPASGGILQSRQSGIPSLRIHVSGERPSQVLQPSLGCAWATEPSCRSDSQMSRRHL